MADYRAAQLGQSRRLVRGAATARFPRQLQQRSISVVTGATRNNNRDAPRPQAPTAQTPAGGRPAAASMAPADAVARVSKAAAPVAGDRIPPPSSTAPAGGTRGSAPATDLNRSLLAALAEQFQRESLPWIQDLVVPLFEGPPQPLRGTEPPERLADRDSRFVTVNGVRLHYKMALPGEREGSHAEVAAAAAGSAARRNVQPRPPQPPQQQPAGVAGAVTPRASSDPAPSSTSASAPSSTSASAPSSTSASAPSSSAPSSSSKLKLSSLLAWRPPPAADAAPAPVSAASAPSSSSSRPPAAVAAAVDPPPPPSPDPDAAPTLLLMHGLNGSTFNWRLLMDDLAAYVSPGTGGCRVVAYDRPPYGLSQRPLTWPSEEDNPYTLEGGARLAAGLLDALLGPLPPTTPSSAASSASSAASLASVSPLSLRNQQTSGRRAVLVGHSAGAAVAVEAALRYPERVCGLVLIAPAISTDPRGFLARADLGQLLRFAWTRALLSADGPGLNYVRRQVLKRKAEVEAGRLGIYADEREVPQEVIDGYLRPLRAKDWDRGTLLVYRSLQVSGAPPPLETTLRVPVLVVQGGEDRTVPLEAAQAVTEALRRRRGSGAVTEFVVLEGCGHVPMDEQPLQVLKVVADFVNRHCCGRDGGADGDGGGRTRDIDSGGQQPQFLQRQQQQRQRQSVPPPRAQEAADADVVAASSGPVDVADVAWANNGNSNSSNR